MKNLYPLRGLPQQGQIWSWISFDVANQSFTLIINTLLFSIFFKDIVVGSNDRGVELWSLATAASMALVVLASPIVGAVADERSWKKESLIGTGLACALLTCGFGLIGPGDLVLALALYIPANFMFNIGENFLASFLPSLARQDDLGKVSGFSWACAYSSALFLLVLTVALMEVFGWKNPDQWRPFFVIAGVWFLLFSVPTMFKLREPPVTVGLHSERSLFTVGFVRLWETCRNASRFRDLAVLLAASLFYGVAMSIITGYASILADAFGFKAQELVVFVAVIAVSGVVGTLLPTLAQDRLGHRKMTLLLLGLWLVTSCAFAYYAHLAGPNPAAGNVPKWPLWVIGNLIGFGLGSLGAANRAFVGYLTPRHKSGEFFGLWGLVFKAAGVLTPVFAFTKSRIGVDASLLVLAGFVLVGLMLTLFVDERRGHAAAAAAEAEAGA